MLAMLTGSCTDMSRSIIVWWQIRAPSIIAPGQGAGQGQGPHALLPDAGHAVHGWVVVAGCLGLPAGRHPDLALWGLGGCCCGRKTAWLLGSAGTAEGWKLAAGQLPSPAAHLHATQLRSAAAPDCSCARAAAWAPDYLPAVRQMQAAWAAGRLTGAPRQQGCEAAADCCYCC